MKYGESYSIPLPDGATEFANEAYPGREGMKQYVAVEVEVYSRYLKIVPYLSDYSFDQMGRILVPREKHGKITFYIETRNFARRYKLLNVGYE